MGGPNCYIVGCAASYSRHKGLSFHKIPAKGKSSEVDEWRGRLIAKISRSDKGFNVDGATICSRHFSDDCFEPYGNYLVT